MWIPVLCIVPWDTTFCSMVFGRRKKKKSGKPVKIFLLHWLMKAACRKVLLNGKDISDQIRQEEVGNMASATSGYGFVRAKLLSLQQDMAAQYDVIMDGRDIGTCVLPNAQLKIFLTASVQVRAKRRYDELVEKGECCDLAEIEKDISERDYRDMHREIAPLKAAEDAVMLDSSELNIDEVVEAIYEYAKKAGLEA